MFICCSLNIFFNLIDFFSFVFFLWLFRSNMLRLTMSSRYQFHSWFTYSMLLLFLFTAGFWVIKLIAGTNLKRCSLDFCSCHCDNNFFSNLTFSVSQMARLNEGLSLFDAILIVPMFQIAWTFFSICTGFVYFQEYQVSFCL